MVIIKLTFIIIVSVYFVELCLRLYLRFKKIKVGVRYPEKFPLFNKKYYKIAIFGGSCAYGYTAELSLTDYLNNYSHKINGKPVKCFRIARNGWPFLNAQNLLFEKLHNFFDLSIIWEGQNDYVALTSKLRGNLNEFQEYFSHSAKSIEKSIKNKLRYHILDSFYLTFIAMSRVFELLNSLLPRTDNSEVSSKSSNWFIPIDEVTNNPPIDLDKKKEIEHEYKEVLQNIIHARSNSKNKIIILTIANNDLWPPCQSKISGSIASFSMLTNKIELEINTSPKNGVYTSLEDVKDYFSVNDDKPAKLLFLVGLLHIKKGEINQGCKLLDEAFTNDYGTTLNRSNRRMRELVMSISVDNQHSAVSDIDALFKSHIGNSQIYERFFSDVQHLSSFGHFLVFENIISILKKLDISFDLDESFNDIYDCSEIENKLKLFNTLILNKIPERQINYNTFMILRWHVSVYGLYSKPSVISSRAKVLYEQLCSQNYFGSEGDKEFWGGMTHLCQDNLISRNHFLKCIKIEKKQYKENLMQVSAIAVAYGLIIKNYLNIEYHKDLLLEEMFKN